MVEVDRSIRPEASSIRANTFGGLDERRLDADLRGPIIPGAEVQQVGPRTVKKR
jgi:hypothetical protein